MRADKAYSSAANRAYLRRRGIAAVIPVKEDQKTARRKRGSAGGRPPRFDPDRYRTRNCVERCINKLKQFRAVATRYDKRRVIYQGRRPVTPDPPAGIAADVAGQRSPRGRRTECGRSGGSHRVDGCLALTHALSGRAARDDQCGRDRQDEHADREHREQREHSRAGRSGSRPTPPRHADGAATGPQPTATAMTSGRLSTTMTPAPFTSTRVAVPRVTSPEDDALSVEYSGATNPATIKPTPNRTATASAI